MPPKKKEAAPAVAPTTETAAAVENTSVLRYLLSLNSNKPQLEFGINLNCRLISINNTVKVKEGVPIPRNTFLTFAKYNAKNEVIGQTEFNFFNLDPEGKFTLENFIEQLSKLTVLCKLLAPEAAYDPTTGFGFETMEAIADALKSPGTCKKLQDRMYDDFAAIVTTKIGAESPLLALKVVTEKSGKYLQLPKEDKFCALMSKNYDFLRISAYEQKMKDAALQPATATPDEKGAAPSKEKSSTLEGL